MSTYHIPTKDQRSTLIDIIITDRLIVVTDQIYHRSENTDKDTVLWLTSDHLTKEGWSSAVGQNLKKENENFHAEQSNAHIGVQ